MLNSKIFLGRDSSIGLVPGYHSKIPGSNPTKGKAKKNYYAIAPERTAITPLKNEQLRASKQHPKLARKKLLCHNVNVEKKNFFSAPLDAKNGLLQRYF